MKIHITMIPDSRPGAYYQMQLTNALYKEGINVIFPEKINEYHLIFPIFDSILFSKTKILHIHWIEGFTGFRSRNILFSFLKSFLFLIDIYLIKYILKTKIIWTIHNLYTHECSYPRIERIVRKFLTKIVDAIICHCNQAKTEIQSEFATSENKINVIPIGNYVNCYKNEILKEKALKILNLKSEDLIFLSFGQLRPYKGINKLIESFKSICRNKNEKLLIIGKPLTSQIKTNLIKVSKNSKNIIFVFSFIPDDDIQIYFKASDVIIFSFQAILSSAGVPLAMSFGKPIIAPRLGCVIDILDDIGSFLYNPHESEGLSRVLEKAIENKDLLKEMGKHNLNLAKLYDWKKIGIQTKKLYERLLK